jgi:adenosylmethionine-8-amino-7-oxononanoate aminotransferase
MNHAISATIGLFLTSKKAFPGLVERYQRLLPLFVNGPTYMGNPLCHIGQLTGS